MQFIYSILAWANCVAYPDGRHARARVWDRRMYRFPCLFHLQPNLGNAVGITSCSPSAMDWKLALLYVLFCLLTLALLFCAVLVRIFLHWKNKDVHFPADTSLPTSAPDEEEVRKAEEPTCPILSSPHTEILENLSPDSRKLWEKLIVLMEKEEVWRDPNLTLNSLSAMLGTNRTRFCHLVQEAGYTGYKDYINRHRIHAFLQLVKTDGTTSIQNAFFSVGYQSKMTALRHFKMYTGMTPTEYLQGLKEGKEKNH